MQDRADILAAVLSAVAFLGTEIYVAFNPSSLGSNGPTPLVYLILTAPIFPYAAYWAFSIRHALRVPLYRRQAFGIGFVVLAIWTVIGLFVALPGGPAGSTANALEGLVANAAFYFLFITLFYWIDSSILASRRSDPLLRDTLYWGKVRIPLWIAIIVTAVIPFLILGFVAISQNQVLMDQLNAGTIGGPVVSLIMNTVIFNFPIVIPICGLIYLPAIAVRAKWDRNLRRHFLWFAPPSLVILAVFFGVTSGGPITPLLVVIMGYSLYRSAKALVPLNRVAAPDPTSISNSSALGSVSAGQAIRKIKSENGMGAS